MHGEVEISGAKNAVLPIMAATLLTAEPCGIRRVPNLSDVRFMGQILEWLGAKVKLDGDAVHVHARKIKGHADYDLVRKMRGSICIMGPLLGRLRKATVSLPGGCVIGARPINLHLKAFAALGAKIKIENGYVAATAPRLAGGPMFLGGRSGSTVLGTANAMMAAVLADGVTIIESAACEPEVVDLAKFLTAMGAKLSGVGSPTITITGVKELHGAEHEVIADRIEAATFAIAAAAMAKVAASIRSAMTSCSAPCNSLTPVMVTVGLPTPESLAPIAVRNFARSTTSGSHAALSIIVTPSASTAAIMALAVPSTVEPARPPRNIGPPTKRRAVAFT